MWAFSQGDPRDELDVRQDPDLIRAGPDDPEDAVLPGAVQRVDLRTHGWPQSRSVLGHYLRSTLHLVQAHDSVELDHSEGWETDRLLHEALGV